MQRRELGPADRAVYALIERGGIDAVHAPLYRRQLSALAKAGLVSKDDAGGYHAVPSKAVAPGTIPPPPVRREPPMQTLICRIPVETMNALDAMGPTRSDAARAVLAKGLERTRSARPD